MGTPNGYWAYTMLKVSVCILACYGLFTLVYNFVSPPDYTMTNAQAQAYCNH